MKIFIIKYVIIKLIIKIKLLIIKNLLLIIIMR